MRAPFDLRQPGYGACLSCVTANILYMFEARDRPDVSWVDRQIGRKPGKEAEYARASRLLLQYGFSMLSVCSFDHEGFISESLAYLKEFYRNEWDSTWEKFWTPERLDDFRRQCDEAKQLKAFGRSMQAEMRTPTVDDIRTSIYKGRVVQIVVDNAQGPEGCHAVLVYSYEGRTFDLYYPDYTDSCLRTWSQDKLLRYWLPDEGMAAYWRP